MHLGFPPSYNYHAMNVLLNPMNVPYTQIHCNLSGLQAKLNRIAETLALIDSENSIKHYRIIDTHTESNSILFDSVWVSML